MLVQPQIGDLVTGAHRSPCGRAAGQKASDRLTAREIGALERDDRNRRNRVPLGDGVRRAAAAQTELAIWCTVCELMGEIVQGERVEPLRSGVGDERQNAVV